MINKNNSLTNNYKTNNPKIKIKTNNFNNLKMKSKI